MVQSRAQVVYAVTDQNAQLGWRLLYILESGDEAAFVVELRDSLIKVRLNEPLDAASEFFEVVFGPVDLEREAVQRVRHALTSPQDA
jgi:hypothetical protein